MVLCLFFLALILKGNLIKSSGTGLIPSSRVKKKEPFSIQIILRTCLAKVWPAEFDFSASRSFISMGCAIQGGFYGNVTANHGISPISVCRKIKMAIGQKNAATFIANISKKEGRKDCKKERGKWK